MSINLDSKLVIFLLFYVYGAHFLCFKVLKDAYMGIFTYLYKLLIYNELMKNEVK